MVETLGCTFGLARIFKVEYFALNFGVLKAPLCEQLRRLDFRIQAQSRLLAKPGSSFLCRSFFYCLLYLYVFVLITQRCAGSSTCAMANKIRRDFAFLAQENLRRTSLRVLGTMSTMVSSTHFIMIVLLFYVVKPYCVLVLMVVAPIFFKLVPHEFTGVNRCSQNLLSFF